MAGFYFTRYCVRLGMLAIAATVCLEGRAVAQDVPACLQHPAKLSDTAVQSFMERPAGLLETHPAGGVVMSAAIRRLAGSDITTVPPLAFLAKDANVSQ